jgi:hypothetical protein
MLAMVCISTSNELHATTEPVACMFQSSIPHLHRCSHHHFSLSLHPTLPLQGVSGLTVADGDEQHKGHVTKAMKRRQKHAAAEVGPL